ncbi:unnamed protein product [Protopolystoma xenopodis]|uniref:Secreted protein n=1 Tax=Protopolystoma xenopodis TaxID=117903 RepID=A0A3S5AI87_9PLAT|nr:unnamed protein product [Protopolystoma xenopodis]
MLMLMLMLLRLHRPSGRGRPARTIEECVGKLGQIKAMLQLGRWTVESLQTDETWRLAREFESETRKLTIAQPTRISQPSKPAKLHRPARLQRGQTTQSVCHFAVNKCIYSRANS